MPPDDPKTPLAPETPPDPPKPADPTDTAAAKRERQTYPIRVLSRQPDGDWSLVPPVAAPSFDTIAKAERWLMAEGNDGETFLLARIIGGPRTVEPRKVTEGTL